MAGRRRGWFRSSGNDEWIEHARARLATAFLDMDRRQSAADAAVHAADQVFPERGTGARWEPVRHSCYDAAEVYLTLSAELEAAQRGGPPIPQGQQRADAAVGRLTAAARAVDEFYRGDQSRLEEAVAVLGAVPQLVQQVKAAAAVMRTQAAESEFASYPSVRKGAAAVDEALVTLEAAGVDRPAGAVREAANRLAAVTKELADALAQAPSRAAAANTAISSVTTRLAAVRTRAEGVPPAFSALLREFNAASSADLANNERESQRAIEAAAAVLGRARAAAAENNPEFALDLTTSARGFLTEAEQRVDAVTKRLALLRAIRSDPQEQAKAVRFRLRDAQMLAVSRGLVAEWGSVLDAQAARIDRISETLSGRNPDYWAYVAELDAVTEFIAGVVDRMRKQAGPRRE
ncbi:hypothetical protein LTT66_11235 [Nocardia gipuzkoensis]|uniref:hypothetical protein n=1 Tax=Nocardia gipuzkoensis TaxID=2749991 RepID=UPI001E43CD22|nr:hypothetical protein [Nocardia gipuzkoensis]UGT70688.1 hypothetical protein LTT66_11235 [Nocardia gipuzkoensis]